MKNKSFNSLIESILEAGYSDPASQLTNGYDRDDPTDNMWLPREVAKYCTLDIKPNNRQLNKDKLIARKQNLINKHQQALDNWLDIISQRDNVSSVAIETQRRKAQRKINNEIAELERIKKLPISDNLFN
jgi:hypothetical protein